MRLLRWIVAAICLLVVVAPSAHAHTAVLGTEPAPGATVAAPLAELRISFLDPIQAAPVVTLVGPDGAAVPTGVVGLADGDRVAIVPLDGLAAAGTYEVTYEFRAVDGDRQVGSHTFRLEVAPAGADGRAVVGAALGIAALVGIGVVILRSRRSGPEPADSTSAAAHR